MPSRDHTRCHRRTGRLWTVSFPMEVEWLWADCDYRCAKSNKHRASYPHASRVSSPTNVPSLAGATLRMIPVTTRSIRRHTAWTSQQSAPGRTVLKSAKGSRSSRCTCGPHLEEYTYKCDVPGCTFPVKPKTRQILAIHKLVHTGEKPFKLPQGWLYIRLQSRTQLEGTHNEHAHPRVITPTSLLFGSIYINPQPVFTTVDGGGTAYKSEWTVVYLPLSEEAKS
ncbi:hypothetical protein GE09DRAFT_144929 [Coniochaeta sp. 2T2.1]|nr:hypothetical protein GE09DRAFT_144929 [Coniochaeta sp. 2T2.1]